MVRTSLPGGVLSAEQWLAADALADEVADGTLRITTRQDLQFHFVHKGDLRRLISTLNEHLVTTLAACGDVVRNVVCCPAPVADRDQAHRAGRRPGPVGPLQAPERRLLRAVGRRREGRHRRGARGRRRVEPLYGEAYLPRKFKIGFAFPGDNCIDVYTQDVGLVPVERDGAPGYVVLVGGGLGQSHAREDDTYPRLASPLVWVAADDLAPTVEAVITIHRDFGNREDRHRARLKYVVDERGLEWFRAEVERRVGHALADPGELPEWLDSADHLGWWQDGHGALGARRAGAVGPGAGRPARRAARGRRALAARGPPHVPPGRPAHRVRRRRPGRRRRRLRRPRRAPGRRAAPRRPLRHDVPGPADVRPGPRPSPSG